jgi:hypothetical protein
VSHWHPACFDKILKEILYARHRNIQTERKSKSYIVFDIIIASPRTVAESDRLSFKNLRVILYLSVIGDHI